MTVRVPTISTPGIQQVAVWSGLLNGDTGTPVYFADYSDKTFQVKGTFGAAGSVAIEGSSDGGTTWASLHDPQGNAIAQTAASIEMIAENPLLVRPNVTAGDGTTSLTVIINGVKQL